MPGIRYFRCPRCSCPKFSLKALFRHLRVVHGHESNWLCGLGGCMKTFSLFLSYKRHVYRKHADLLKEGTKPSADIPLQVEQRSVDDAQREDAEGQEEVLSDSQSSESSPSSIDYVNQLAALLLKWKEARRLPESTLNEIANDVISFIQAMLEDVQLCTCALSVAHKAECKQQLSQLLSRSTRLRYWRTHFPVVEPRMIVLGVNSRGKDTMTYVPLCSVLKCVLEHSDLSSDFNSYPKKENYLCSAFDGAEFQEHAYFSGDTSKICIQLYSDEFEVCNPLGSKRGKHKMTAVYFSVLNFATKARSALSGIHLVLLVNDKHVSTYGFPKIFAPLIADVKEIEEEGINVGGNLLKGSVFIFTGDNLSSHRVGGFKCSFSHGRICRFCMALHHELSHKFLESDFHLRTPYGHQHHLNMLSAGLPTASLYGVRERCALEFRGFLPTQHLPPDLMHDIHEGVLPFALQHIISSLIKQNFFSLTYLNKMICEWHYDPHDSRNKPEPLSNQFLKGKAAMKASATQVFCLFRHLGLYVGVCVPTGNQVWQLYLLLREIVDIIMCYRIPTNYIAYLQRKIHFFCLEFKSLFPSSSLPCKVHYLIHYPSQIRKFGPLSTLWAMRFEAKHQYFKDISRKIRNWKNLSQSLAVRHQLLQSFTLIAPRDDSISTTGCSPVLYEHLPECVQQFVSEHSLECSSSSTVSSLRVAGRMFKVGCCLVQDISLDDMPEFVHVCGIYYVNKVLLVVLNVLETVSFDEHFHVYVVNATQEYKVLTSFSEFESEPLYMRQHKGRTVINTRQGLL